MKLILVFLSVMLLSLATSFAQDSMLTPPKLSEESDSTASSSAASLTDPVDGSSIDPGAESKAWASAKFADFKKDADMCDDGTALYENDLRSEAMREHPEWPIWSIDLALEDARDSYLRAMLFPE